MANSPVYAPSSGFLSGHFGIADLADDMCDYMISQLDSYVATGQKKAKAVLVEGAEGPWEVASRFLEVDVNRGLLSVEAVGPVDIIEAVEELEFGTIDMPPVPYVRNSVDTLVSVVQEHLNSQMREDVPLV